MNRVLCSSLLAVFVVPFGLGCDPEPEPRCEAAPGRICTLAGTGMAGLGDDGLHPTETDLYLPMDAAIGPDELVYLTDWNNHRIRRIRNDVVETVVGTGYLGDAPDGHARRTALNHPVHVSFAPNGEMIIAAWHNSKILRYSFSTQTVTTICGDGRRSFGGDGGPATEAILDLPVSTAFSPDGRMYIADQGNQRIRIVDLDGIIDTVIGTGERGYSGDGGEAALAQINLPTGQSAPPSGRIATDAEGNVYIADSGNHRVRKVDTNGIITTVAGNGERGYAGDGGLAIEARLSRPNDVAVDDAGNLYVADTDNHCVRKVTPDGVISTYAGICGERGREADDMPALEATLDRPYGVEVGRRGEVYIADTHNHSLRVVFP